MRDPMPESPESRAALRRRESFQIMANKTAFMSMDEMPRYRALLIRFVNSSYFESVIGILIIFNMILTWYETDLSAQEDTRVPDWLKAMNLLMLILYGSEVALRLITLRERFFEGYVNWDTFDLLLVLSDIVFLVIKAVFPEMEGNPGIRALRICRSLRMVKAIRIWPPLRELYIMMHGLIGAFKAMVWSFVMLFLVLTLFGIIAVETINPIVKEIHAEGGFSDCDRCHRAFASVWSSMITFFQQVVAGDSWGLITIPVMEREAWTQPLFITVVVTIQFGILNLILVAIVDQAHQSSKDDALFQVRTRQEEFERSRRELIALCAEIDTDESGNISMEELMHGYETKPELANQMRFLDVKKDDMKILFAVLDHDGSGSVDYEEFVEQLFNMQNQDTGVVLSFIRSYVQDVRKQLVTQGRELDAIKTICSGLRADQAGLPSCSVNASPMLDLGRCTMTGSPSTIAESDLQSPPHLDDFFKKPDSFEIPAQVRQQCSQNMRKMLLERVQQTCDEGLLEYERSLMLLKESVQNCEIVASTNCSSSDSTYEKSRSAQPPPLLANTDGKQVAETLEEGVFGCTVNAEATLMSQSREWQPISGPGSEGQVFPSAISRV